MKNRDGLENSNDWETPDWLYEALDQRFHFDFDPCPINPTFNGLASETTWGSSNYINPPYDRRNKPLFVERAYNEWVINGSTNILLIPAATDTISFHELLMPGAIFLSWDSFLKLIKHDYQKAIVFFKGRISFKGYNTKGEYVTTNKGKHASMLIILNSL